MRCLYAGPVLCRPCFFVQWGQRWTESGPEDNREPLKNFFLIFMNQSQPAAFFVRNNERHREYNINLYDQNKTCIEKKEIQYQ